MLCDEQQRPEPRTQRLNSHECLRKTEFTSGRGEWYSWSGCWLLITIVLSRTRSRYGKLSRAWKPSLLNTRSRLLLLPVGFVRQRTWDGYDGERQQLIVDDMEYMNKDITTVLLQSYVGNVGRCLGTNMEDLCNRNVTTYF